MRYKQTVLFQALFLFQERPLFSGEAVRGLCSKPYLHSHGIYITVISLVFFAADNKVTYIIKCFPVGLELSVWKRYIFQVIILTKCLFQVSIKIHLSYVIYCYMHTK